MLDPWELILHHTYSGTPGVIFDHSPKHGSHGTLVELTPGDFVLDGATSGSGAFRGRRNGYVAVTPSYGWDRLGAIRIEVTFKCDTAEGAQHFLDGRPQSVFCGIFEGTVDFGFRTPDGWPGAFLGLQRFGVTFEEAGISPGEWHTVSAVHDGYGTVVISANGEVVRSWRDTPLQPVPPMSSVTIGNAPVGPLPIRGLLDEIKVWRPNDNRIKSDFTERVVKAGVTDCWVQWGKKFRDTLDELAAIDVECPQRIAHLIDAVARSVLPAVLTRSAASREAWDRAVADYRRLWTSGHVADIHDVLTGLLDALRVEGVDLENNPAYVALINDPCYQKLIGMTPPLTCDPDFVRMLHTEGS